ncbi:MAG: hypothetical protein SGJ11_18040 [Phycisphaerae bacterium]|nr:hypothetical protein [Phycisphaerae bacterium]
MSAMNPDRSPDDAELLRWMRHLRSLAAGVVASDFPPDAALRPARAGAATGEILVWNLVWNLTRRAAAVTEADLASIPLDLAGDGPLWSPDRWAAIEVWTEAELCGLHGLWRLARTAAGTAANAIGPLLERRIAGALHWHLEHTQPDNATHRPWAVHAFLLSGSAEARFYAETLVHNVQAQAPDEPTCQWILADSARELQRWLARC